MAVNKIYDINSGTNVQNADGTMNLMSLDSFQYPGYMRAHIDLLNSNDTVKLQIPFLVSPSSYSEARTNNVQLNKTHGGYFAMRCGKAPVSVSFSGYMIDLKSRLEKHEFLQLYTGAVEDQRVNNTLEYYNNYVQRLTIEGRSYYGYIQNVSFSKTAQNLYVNQYSINFTAFTDEYTHPEILVGYGSIIKHNTGIEKKASLSLSVFNSLSLGKV